MPAYIQTLIEHLHNHPFIGLMFAFIVAFVESIAILGTIVPGSVTMTAVGAMVGSGILPITSTLSISIVGALLGDLLSYWFGWKYKDRIPNLWPFNKYQKLMQLGEKFFKSHGGKSVVIGRFFGPVRSLVPLIAGVLHMRPALFLFAAVISATSWAIVYMLPGIFLGALSLELPAGKATEFLGYALAIILFAWAFIWTLRYLFQTSWHYVDDQIAKLWLYLRTHRGLNYLPKLIENPRSPDDHRQLTLLFLALLTLFIFLFVVINVKLGGFLTAWDKPIYALLQSFHVNWLYNLCIGVTFLGDKYPLVVAAFFIFLIFGYRRSFWGGLHWALLTMSSVVAIHSVKLWAHILRPGMMYATIKGATSFPSGHVGFSTALFGFSAVLIATELSGTQRRRPYTLAFFLITIIALSRLYLGAHWFSDVIGALFLGASLVLFFTVSYRRKLDHALSAKFLITLIPSIFLLCCLGYGIARFNAEKQKYTHTPVIETLSYEAWWDNKTLLPLYRTNRFGLPIQPLNIQWVGDLSSIRKTLREEGWRDDTRKNTLKNIILQDLTEEENQRRLYLFSRLYKNKPPVLLMTKAIGERWMLLELWDAGIHLTGVKYPLYLGVLYLPSPHKWLTMPHQDIYFTIGELAPVFSKFGMNVQQKLIRLPDSLLPKRTQNLFPERQWEVIKLVEKSKK